MAVSSSTSKWQQNHYTQSENSSERQQSTTGVSFTLLAVLLPEEFLLALNALSAKGNTFMLYFLFKM